MAEVTVRIPSRRALEEAEGTKRGVRGSALFILLFIYDLRRGVRLC